jgi:Zn-dependent membrane protease YugP
MFGYGYGYYPMYFDSTYWLIIVGVIICLAASARVKSAFNKYSKVRSYSGMTGAQAAERILHAEGIYDVKVQHIRGNLNDHYDPRNKVLNLSDSTYGASSVAAIGVAAHECGHAIQHAHSYAPLVFRNAIVPVVNFASGISWILIIIGLFISSSSSSLLINLGIICFSAAVLFQLVTLPVEFNASKRALVLLETRGILGSEEIVQTKKVLSAAALTYVAAAAASILQLLRLVFLFGGRNRD